MLHDVSCCSPNQILTGFINFVDLFAVITDSPVTLPLRIVGVRRVDLGSRANKRCIVFKPMTGFLQVSPVGLQFRSNSRRFHSILFLSFCLLQPPDTHTSCPALQAVAPGGQMKSTRLPLRAVRAPQTAEARLKE